MVGVDVATIEERVASLEGRMQEQSLIFTAIHDQLDELRRESTELRRDMNRRFAGIDQRFTAIDQKMSTQFHWLLGVLMTTWISLGVLLAGALLRP
jgi:23S rRNA maturation mini-RNase III